MKRVLTILLLLALTLSVLASCGETGEPGPSGTEASAEAPSTGSEPDSEPATQPEKPAAEPLEYEYRYEAPADGSFTVCGKPLSDYTLVVYWPANEFYGHWTRGDIINPLRDLLLSVTGIEFEISVVKNDKYNEEPKLENEILLGPNFRRQGMPDFDEGACSYGVTPSGCIYFHCVSPLFFDRAIRTFLEEFFGVPYGTEGPSGGCNLSEFYREFVYNLK